MDAKMKECLTPHAMMHGLLGIGLGIILVNIIPGLNSFWLGVVIAVVAIVLDKMRK